MLDSPAGELLLIGACHEPGLLDRIAIEAKKLGISDPVKYQDYLEVQEAMELVKRSRIGLAVLQPHANFLHSLPTKVFDYLSVELPVVLSDFPYYREFFRNVPGITLVDPTDVNAIASCLRDLASMPEQIERLGRRSRQSVFERFSWESEGKRLVNIYAGIMRRGRELRQPGANFLE